MEYHADNFTNPLAILTTMFTVLLMGFGTYYTIRRYNYELFYYSHHFAMIIFAVMLWHATMSWYYITAGLILWTIDHAIRLSRSVGLQVDVRRLAVEGDGNITVLWYTVKNSSLMVYEKLFPSENPTPSSKLNHQMV